MAYKANEFLKIPALAILGLALSASHPVNAAQSSDISKDPVAGAALNSVTLIPHRAIYKISMAPTKNGGTMSDIDGRMYYSWADDCNDWNVEQKMIVRFFYGEGDASTTTSSLIAREAKDGSNYIYRSAHTTDKDPTEVIRGSAHIGNAAGSFGEASFNAGADKKLQFSSATTFPAHHTLELLTHAKNGEKFFATNVFDGADDQGLNEVSSFIAAPIEPSIMEKTAATGGLAGNPLLKGKAWPIRMAFFAPDSKGNGQPDYEMDMVLLENGIMKSMTIDYGDFAMKAELVNVESLPPSKCKAPAVASLE